MQQVVAQKIASFLGGRTLITPIAKVVLAVAANFGAEKSISFGRHYIAHTFSKVVVAVAATFGTQNSTIF